MLVKWEIVVYKQSIVVSLHRLLCRIVELKKGWSWNGRWELLGSISQANKGV